MFWDKIADYYIGCCCKGHDKRYANKRLTRLQADILLFKCVKRKANVILAATMFSFVRAFGWYFYNKVQRELNKASELAVY